MFEENLLNLLEIFKRTTEENLVSLGCVDHSGRVLSGGFHCRPKYFVYVHVHSCPAESVTVPHNVSYRMDEKCNS